MKWGGFYPANPGAHLKCHFQVSWVLFSPPKDKAHPILWPAAGNASFPGEFGTPGPKPLEPHLQELVEADWIPHGEVGEPGGGFQERLESMESQNH